MTINIGIVGFGLMGRTHLNAYLVDPRARVVAIADSDRARFDATAFESNFGGDRSDFDLRSVRKHEAFAQMLGDDEVDAVSICSPTAQHVGMTISALDAGKHVLVEKPLGLASCDAARAVEAAARHADLVAMPAMCMRFWPAWRWLRDSIHDRRYGPVRSATFTRIGAMPTWAEFYKDAAQSGAAILDLHIHDADFVRYCFGDPASVTSKGYSETTEGVDHVITHYHFSGGPHLVIAEGGWSMKPNFEFTMRYLVNFEGATARFDFGSNPQLRVTNSSGGVEAIDLSPRTGYDHEVAYFLDCIERGERPTIVTIYDGAEAVRLIEAERHSVESGRPVAFAGQIRAG